MRKSKNPAQGKSEIPPPGKGRGRPRIPWHPAFVEAMRLELGEFQGLLEFISEYQLGSEPLRVDCIIIKKARGAAIGKNIAEIFREVNLIEYKSPDDYISVHDFYKAYAYGCLYSAINKAPISEITLTFIGSRKPRRLLSHLKGERGYEVEETQPGIYNVIGDIMPIQAIESRKLAAEENLWLRGLSKSLGARECLQVDEEIAKLGKGAQIQAYIDAIAEANPGAVKEAIGMRKSKLTLYDVYVQTGIAAELEARGKALGEAIGEARGEARGKAIGEAWGEERKAVEVARNLINLGLPIQTIISATGIDPEKAKDLGSYENPQGK